MNVKLLREIAKVIQEKPKQFSLASWHKSKTDGVQGVLCNLPKAKQVACGTTHCIAGWAQVLAPDRDCTVPARADGQRVLGLSNEQANRLFFGEYWPKGYGGYRTNAAKAAARIEHFIRTNGAE
jgi:hypothetical protein